jgi:tyrosyl-tRNA synthetase
MFGKVMSLPDAAMGSFFRLVTRWNPEAIASLEADLAAGSLHPRDAKMKLAGEIVAIYFGDTEAGAAEAEFRRVYQKGGVAEPMVDVVVPPDSTLVDVLASSTELASSRSEARRLISQGAVRLGGRTLTDSQLVISFTNGDVLEVGRHRSARLIHGDD